MKLKLALFCGLALAGANAMACYTVYDRNDRVVYRGMEPPVDMSRPLHETLGRQFPGAHMVFNQGVACTPVALAQLPRPTAIDTPVNTIRLERDGRTVSPLPAPTSNAPLLTDRETALRNGLPIGQELAGGAVLVPGRAVAHLDLPSFSVIETEPQLARAPLAPNTAVMGAGPAVPTRPGAQTVITELRDGSTVVQTGNSVSVLR